MRKFYRRLHDSGVNRLSIGGQSFNQNELEFLGRGHSPEDIKKAVSAARKAGFGNISLDLIFAIPDSTLSSRGNTVCGLRLIWALSIFRRTV